MVARGDMGVEISPEKVFLAQKSIIAKCNMAGKPVICATEMLESMTRRPRPTRAELSDVANAVLDGADCLMLSAETASGAFPVAAACIMDSACRQAEAALCSARTFAELRRQVCQRDSELVAAADAVQMTFKTGAAAILVLTSDGRSAHQIARFRPSCPVLVVTRSELVARQSRLHRALVPIVVKEPENGIPQNTGNVVMQAITLAKQYHLLVPGDTLVYFERAKGARRPTIVSV
ncbi:pyruvate kinase-like [Pollicipes pollicipes]|uniref:pyruvate kinase-like n=1 Tax=Pollicipes pollicipes TaxID=41117 RepID=UPI00188515E0|nr:pyruvate kinase-like [Pollicipes pollicipes]